MKRGIGMRPRLGRFNSEDGGNATIEVVIWVPTFVAMLLLVVDVSMIFNGQARLFRMVQDTNRSLSVGRLSTPEEAEDELRAGLGSYGADASIDTTVANGLITTRLSLPARDLDIIGYFSALRNAQVTVTSQHFVEY